MAVMTWTREAKCKDCKWLKPEYLGKRKVHKCLNPMSKYFNSKMTLKDLVCNMWEIS